MAIDTSGNGYIAGSFGGTASFGSTTFTTSGGTDTYLAKVSSTGIYLRAVQGGGTAGDTIYGTKTDSGGNIYIVGSFGGTASFGSTTLTSSGGNDIFLSKLSSTGLYLRAIK